MVLPGFVSTEERSVCLLKLHIFLRGKRVKSIGKFIVLHKDVALNSLFAPFTQQYKIFARETGNLKLKTYLCSNREELKLILLFQFQRF